MNEGRPAVVDGRTARRDRNRDAVLDAVIALFSDDVLEPNPEYVARRSGVSLRSVYRYFADQDELIRAATQRHFETTAPLFAIHGIGHGALEVRIDAFLASRLRGYEAIAATHRAARRHAPANEIIRERLERGRRELRAQVERQFAPELDAMTPPRRRAIAAAVDALTQIESVEQYRVQRRHSNATTRELLTIALTALLADNTI